MALSEWVNMTGKGSRALSDQIEPFDGGKSVFRAGAARSAMPEHRASVATNPGSRLAPPEAGSFGAVASLRIFAGFQILETLASPCEARLATTQNHPGQMVQFGRIVL